MEIKMHSLVACHRDTERDVDISIPEHTDRNE